MRKRLTNSIVESYCGAESAQSNPVLWDTEIKGFGVRYAKRSGVRTYILMFRVRGQKNAMTQSIGRHNDPYRIDQARAEAMKLKAAMLDGVDPVAERKAAVAEAEKQKALNEAQSMTLRQAMLDYFAHRTLRTATRLDYQNFTERHMTTFLDEPVASITRDRVLARVVELEQSSPTQAHKLTVYLSIFLNHAREKFATDEGGYPILPVNPVKRMRKLKPMSPPKPSITRIPLPKVGACWNWLRKQSTEARTENERTAAEWLSFVALTGCRRLESSSLKWSDVDLEGRTITLREDVVKNHSQLVLPMSTVMHELLSTRRNPPPLPHKVLRRRVMERHAAEYVFATNGKKCPHITNAQATVEALTKIAGAHVHVHSLRRTFDSIAMECKIDGDLRRMLLNHKTGDVHARHYSNDARAMADAVQKIADWIVQQGKIAAGDNVIMISPERWNNGGVAARG